MGACDRAKIIGTRTLWDINGFICSDSVSCHVSLELVFFLILPQNLGRNNVGFWQFCSSVFVTGIFIRKNIIRMKPHQILLRAVFAPGFFICSKALQGLSALQLPRWFCGFHNTIFLLYCFMGSPSRQPKKEVECEGEIRKRLKLCGQACREGVGVEQRNFVRLHHGGFQSHWLYFTCRFLQIPFIRVWFVF